MSNLSMKCIIVLQQGLLNQSTSGPSSVLTNKQRTYSQSSEGKKSGEEKTTQSKDSSKHKQSSGSWFGGIWNKLPFRPKNQMILPDDKNPSVSRNPC